jgi:hypothetical protein
MKAARSKTIAKSVILGRFHGDPLNRICVGGYPGGHGGGFHECNGGGPTVYSAQTKMLNNILYIDI